MTVRSTDDGVIELAGVCPVEDAEALLQLVIDRPDSTVDWRSCEDAHAAVVQVLLASGVTMDGAPRGQFLREYIAPLLQRQGA